MAKPSKLHVDIESGGILDLGGPGKPGVGVHRYAADPRTRIWCLSYALDNAPVKLWFPGDPVPASEFAEADEAHAHNAAFERTILKHKLTPLYGFPEIPLEKWRCTMARAQTMALPAKLGLLADALNFEHRKADDAVMRKLAKPRKPKKGEDPNGIYWHDDPETLKALGLYCCKDTECEREADRCLPPLSEFEQQLWFCDQRINDRGFAIDLALIDAAIAVTETAIQELLAEFAKITNIPSPDCLKQFMAWLAARDCKINNLQKTTVGHALRRKNLTPETRRALEIRRDTAHASADKAAALRMWCGDDNRVRGSLNFHAAGTGRWAGRGPQPQNFRREVEQTDAKIAAILSGDMKAFNAPIEAVGDISRGMIVAGPDYRLLIGDFTGIESIVLAGIAGQQSKIDQWKKFIASGDRNDHPYMIEGLSIGHTKETAYQAGKVNDLAFGYQGGIPAFKNFAPKDDTRTNAEIEALQKDWRARHPKIVRFWYRINDLAVAAVRKPGTYRHYGKIELLCEDNNLRIKLPSGRSISYPFPRIVKNKFNRDAVIFKDNAGGKWVDYHKGSAYGGTYAENIVSGFARDLLAEAMIRLEAAGYKIVLTVHDEIVCEMRNGEGTLEEFKRLIEIVPEWAAGLPIVAKVREGLRFAKSDAAEPEIVAKPDAAEAADDPSFSYIWRSKDYDYPCTPTGEEQHDSTGRIYTRVRTPDGGQSFVPKDELVLKPEPTYLDPNAFTIGQRPRCLAGARVYATLGWHVFPAPSNGDKKSLKAAKYSDGHKWGMTIDPIEIERDYQLWPNANCGVVTGPVSGVWVVETDTLKGHGVDGEASLRALEAQHGPLPPTLTARSPSDSLHRYFRYPANGAVIKNSTSKLAPGVDVRGGGGMVLAPPSLRSDGAYTWDNNIPPANPPDWLVQLALASSDSSDELDDENEASTSNKALVADETLVAMAMDVIPNSDVDWETWNRVGMADYGATNGSEIGFAAFDRFSQKSKKYNASNTRAKWEAYRSCPPNRIGAGTLFYLANEANPNWETTSVIAALTGIVNETTTDTAHITNGGASSTQTPKPCSTAGNGSANGGAANASLKPKIAAPYVLRAVNTVSINAARWLWRGHLPIGALELTAGGLGLGKGLLACDFAARASTGRNWPDDSPGPEPGSVIILTAEDRTEDYARRLAAANADRSKVFVLEYVRRNGRDELFLLATDLDKLAMACRDLGDTRLVIIDPITAYMGSGKGFDSHRATDVRAQLHPLKVAAEHLDIAISAITHPPKGAAGRAVVDNFIGSQAYLAAARVGHYCIEELSDEDDRGFRRPTGRVFFTHARRPSHSKTMPTLAFRQEIVCVGTDPKTLEVINVPRIVWDATPIDLTADEALEVNRPKHGDGRKARAAPVREFLRDTLASGPVSRETILERGATEGFSKGQLKRAREAIGAIAYRQIKDQFGSPTLWCLREHTPTDVDTVDDD